MEKWTVACASVPKDTLNCTYDQRMPDDPLASYASTFSYREVARVLRANLGSDEEVVEVVKAAYGSPKLGLLVLTTTRLIYARSRIFRSPRIISMPLDQLARADFRERPVSGELAVALQDGTSFAFRNLVPKSHAWAYSQIASEK